MKGRGFETWLCRWGISLTVLVLQVFLQLLQGWLVEVRAAVTYSGDCEKRKSLLHTSYELQIQLHLSKIQG